MGEREHYFDADQGSAVFFRSGDVDVFASRTPLEQRRTSGESNYWTSRRIAD
jgi:hypothetical protein